MRSQAVLCLSVALLFTGLTQKAQSATVHFFTDFDSFDQITTTDLIEDFEAVTPKNALVPSFINEGNVYTSLNSSPSPRNIVVASPGYRNFGVSVTTSSVLTANGDENFKIDFGSPSRAIGFDTYLNPYGPATVRVFGDTGLLDTFTLNHDPTQVGFLGIVSERLVTSIQWETTNGRSVNTGIDNLRQGDLSQSESVPEPLSLLGLIGISIVGAKLVNRR